MRSLVVTAILMSLGAGSAHADAFGRGISQSQAELKCAHRVQDYINTPRGQTAAYPPLSDARPRYRQCVYGYVKQYPTRYPNFQYEKLFNLNGLLRKI